MRPCMSTPRMTRQGSAPLSLARIRTPPQITQAKINASRKRMSVPTDDQTKQFRQTSNKTRGIDWVLTSTVVLNARHGLGLGFATASHRVQKPGAARNKFSCFLSNSDCKTTIEHTKKLSRLNHVSQLYRFLLKFFPCFSF